MYNNLMLFFVLIANNIGNFLIRACPMAAGSDNKLDVIIRNSCAFKPCHQFLYNNLIGTGSCMIVYYYEYMLIFSHQIFYPVGSNRIIHCLFKQLLRRCLHFWDICIYNFQFYIFIDDCILSSSSIRNADFGQ
ncbi:hypothetical protein SDC9_153542 [bioreactor metagenome]|uniref:Uncharacterized protein n=1 Tax=bioreactor metagenome TaxID=1076179 RepID=A0A645EXY9_9ZZZZ